MSPEGPFVPILSVSVPTEWYLSPEQKLELAEKLKIVIVTVLTGDMSMAAPAKGYRRGEPEPIVNIQG